MKDVRQKTGNKLDCTKNILIVRYIFIYHRTYIDDEITLLKIKKSFKSNTNVAKIL